MAQSTTDHTRSAPTPASQRAPSVLVVLVTHDGERWLKDCLSSLSKQTHPRLGVIAVDNGSNDASAELLTRALGADRVLRMESNRGFPAAVQAALATEVATRADYVLLMHDDVVLAPDAVERMVEAAEHVEGAGIVGPKVVDWDDPEVLREVGLSTDRFGYAYSPLEEDEIDHGQYDRIREVLFVSSSAMLVSRAAWTKAGPPDERLAARFEDLDLCWRARLAGFRVLMTPQAVARHRAATVRQERAGPGSGGRDRSRYESERAALAAMLKNYSVLSLLWVLPLFAVQGLGRVFLLALSRRFEDLSQVVAAWGWNVLALPGTIRRRVKAQSVRTVPDRAVRRYMAPATLRLRRWIEVANQILLGRGTDLEEVTEEDELLAAPLRARAASLARDHPVAVAWTLASVVALLAFRTMWGPDPLGGGALASVPDSASGFFLEMASPVRTTALGGTQVASPALAGMGLLSTLSFGSPRLAQEVLLVLLPVLAGVTFHRALARRTGRRGASVVGAACYALSATSMWAISEGRVEVLVMLVVLPLLAERLRVAFGPRPPAPPWRFVVGIGVVLAVGAAFEPGVALAAGLLVAAHLVVGVADGHRARGAVLTFGGVAAAALLLFPLVVEGVVGSGLATGSPSGFAEIGLLARFAPGPSPGAWSVAWFLPLAALISFALVEAEQARASMRHLLVAAGGVGLAWASAAGYLPRDLANVPAYLAVAALAASSLVSLGLSSALGSMERHAFGHRQVAVALLAGLLGGGVALTALQAARGDWEFGPDWLPPAWPVVTDEDPAVAYRVLVLGSDDGHALVAPAGDPDGRVVTPVGTFAYALIDRGGRSMLDLARADEGPGYAALERALATAVSGATVHGGSALAPFGVRFVVAEDGVLPPAVLDELASQVDLDRVTAGGLVIFRNSGALPRASVVAIPGFAEAAGSQDDLAPALLARTGDSTVPHVVELRWLGTRYGSSPGASAERFVYLADQGARGWRMELAGDSRPPEPAFGWAAGWRVEATSEPLTLRHDAGNRRLQLAGLAVLWAAALWVTRKPVRRVAPRHGAHAGGTP